ncbi:MAG: undecaprenyldiphospho-muramoylpentapeptide beta-N-acetylglucosaminyltransferase [Spirochaetia bacterium]|jgi:UDP-N-acetylglucosamine--N-acetylmuramyl-(pentapeptide) pyrophosphoryl-undecaprenol N-acetylglucosamine transferase
MAESVTSADAADDRCEVAFAGGGTAGHVFPGIAIAEELGKRILWIGSSTGVEKKLVAEAGIDFRGIPAGKLRRYLSLKNLSDLLKTVAGIVASVRVLRRARPLLVFSKGGYVSVPPVIAARLCGIPSWTHESDFDPGLATRINLMFCEKVLVSFPQTVEYLPAQYRGKAVVTGNPVRRALYHADGVRGRSFVGCPAATPLLFVIGGSLGSSFINALIVSCLPDLLGRCFVVHQMGSRDFTVSKQEGYFTAAFFSAELPDIMAAADLVISRAGANTLAELAALGKPSLLVPLPETGSRGDQIRNAELFRSAGASRVLPEREATAESAAAAVRALLDDPAALAEMGRRARTLGAGRPAELIAGLIRQRLG